MKYAISFFLIGLWPDGFDILRSGGGGDNPLTAPQWPPPPTQAAMGPAFVVPRPMSAGQSDSLKLPADSAP